MSTIGENIRNYRVEMGLSQSQLADKIGMTRSAVSQYESGKIVPKMGSVELLAQALHVKKSDIIGDSFQYAAVDLHESELLDIYRALDERDRAVLLSTARALSRK